MLKRCKPCALCEHELPVECFAKVTKTADGLHPFCDACRLAHPHLNYGICPTCHKRRDLTKFPEMKAGQPCSYCSPQYDGSAVAMLEAAVLQHGGLTTVRDLLRQLGHPDPTKSDLNAGARWLRAHGYRTAKSRGVRGFAVSLSARASEFRQFVEAYGDAADRLDLPGEYREQLMAGAPLPTHLRLALSALIAGLPPYKGGA